MRALVGTTPIPPFDPFGLPAPAWVFELLMLVTMLLHVLFMNLALGGAWLATLLDLLTLVRRGNHNHTVRVIWQAMPVALSFTITTGVAPLLFVQVLFGQFFYTATVFMGFTWFALVPLLIVGFYLVYVLVYRLSSLLTRQLGRWDRAPGKRLLLSLLCAVLFAAVAWVLTNNHMLSIQPDRWAQRGTWLQNRFGVTPATTHPRFAHNVAGAIAVAGLWLAGIGWWRRWRQADPPEIATLITKTGLWTFLHMVVLAAIFGVVLFFMLPQEVSRRLLSPSVYTVLWWVGLLGVVGQLMFGVLALQQPTRFKWFAGLSACAIVTLVGMVAVREAVRLAYLARAGIDMPRIWQHVNPQDSSLTLFAVMLVVALGTVTWLLWISVKARPYPGAGETRP